MRSLLISFLVLFPAVAHADSEHASAAELDGYTAKGGYRAVGGPSAGAFDAPQLMTLRVKKGGCYAFVTRLSDGARWRQQRPSIDFHGWPGSPNLNVGPKLVGASGAVTTVSCAPGDGQVRYAFAPNQGQGTYTVQVYERPGSAGELGAQARARRAARAESRQWDQQQLVKYCRECAVKPMRDRAFCLQRYGRYPRECGW